MSEHAPKSNEALSKIDAAEVKVAPKSAEARAELLEHDKEQRKGHAEAARAKLDKQPEPAAKISENEKTFGSGLSVPFLDRAAAYRDTMRSLQRKLKPASRQFSKVIHNPAVERTSEVLGASVARPSVTLGATTTAALVGGGMYWAARHYGFAVSGSELLFGMLLGGILGFLIELAVRAFGRRPS